MRKQFWLGFLFCLIGAFSLEATSLRLQNETHYPLKATIFGAEGSLLGEVDVAAQKTIIWSDSNEIRTGVPAQGPSKSITPLSVQWHCSDEENFCISEHLTSGSLVRTSQGVGKKVCKPKKELSP